MRLTYRVISVVLLIVCCGFGQSAWGGPYDAQIRLAPESTNLLVLVNAQSIYNSALGKDEELKQKVKDAFATGNALVPPNANRIVMIAEVDQLDGMRPVWDLSVIDLYKAPDVLGFAKREKAPIEHLDGHRLVQTHNGTLVMELKTQRMLTSALATRQMYSRCLKGSAPNAPMRISQYLANAADKVPDDTQVLIALDLAQVFSPQLAQSLLGKDASPRAIECLGSITGLTCEVRFDTARHVAIRLDFAEKLEGLGDDPYQSLQPVLTVLGFSESKLQIQRAKGTAESKAIVLKGELPPDVLRELFRKLETTGTHQDYDEPPPAETADPVQLAMIASRKYLGSLESLLKELKESMRRDTIAEMSERYARKIDGLPMLNVDAELLTFGGNVSGSLRYQAQQKREAGLRTGVRASIPTYSVYGRYGTGYTPYGAYGTNGAYGTYGGYGGAWIAKRDVPDTIGIATQEMAPATQIRISEWKQIEDGLLKIRRTLTERYKVEF